MTSYRRIRWIAALLAVAVVAGACGSNANNAGTKADGGIIDQGQQQAVQSLVENTTTTAAGGTAPAKVTSMDDYDKLWASQRAAIVAKAKANGWAWDQAANKVTGPGGFSVDLSKCASGWDPYQGLDNGTIKIGQTMAFSGVAADYGNIGLGQKVYYDYVNRNGGIKDSTGKTYQITSDQRDDAYDPAKTVPIVDELLDSVKVFALQTLGSPNTLKVYDKMNARCVPDPYVMSGHPGWGDPVNHPWTWGHQLAYNTEAILWGSLIEQRLASQDQINVAALIIQNDFGKAYELGFKSYIATSKKKINLDIERLEPTAVTVTNQMTSLAAKKPDVFIAMTGGTSCTQVLTEAANNGLKESAKMVFMPSVCKGLNFVGSKAVGGDGSTSNGWWIVGGGGKDFNDPAWADDVWVKFARGLLKDGGHPSEDSSQLGNGFAFGWPVVQSLLIAAELPGGVSRPNFMLAARMLDMTNPNLLDGIHYNMAGNDDAYPTEGSEFARFDSTKQSWVKDEQLGIIELSGKSAKCPWKADVSSCG